MRSWRAQALGHALVAGVLLPAGVASVAVAFLRLGGLGFTAADDIRVASSSGAGLVLALFAAGGGLSWIGLREARRCFAIVHGSIEP